LDLPAWGSKGAVNRAGGAIRANTVTEEHTSVLEEWRLAHKHVINNFQALLRARAKDKNVEVAQRLKRRRTIVDKLHRYPRMHLAQMQDVAGCRLIFSTIEELYEFRDGVHRARFKHVLRNEKDKYDYIKSPTDKGYRGIHDVYEFRGRTNNGLLIELQYRTQAQHAWATAVEVVTQATENEPKFGRGDPRHIRLFCLASEILARTSEVRKACLPTLSDTELLLEFDRVEADISVIKTLSNLSAFQWLDDHPNPKHVILHLAKDKEDVQLHQFDLELEASAALLELEKAYPQDDIVLVGAETAAEVKSAFRNYFKDVGDFLKLMSKGRVDLL
jgi:ppGpp synthetase/RelA/SpoT-type nucleotidyltranferase